LPRPNPAWRSERLLPVLVEKQPEGRSPGEKTSVDVCAHGGIVVAEALVCARQRPPQFPLHPYSSLHFLSRKHSRKG
jgi:hypothetical protein